MIEIIVIGRSIGGNLLWQVGPQPLEFFELINWKWCHFREWTITKL